MLREFSMDIRLVLLDVDGVLTDGSLWIGEQGEYCKRFHVRDGMGIVTLQKRGIKVGIITGRSSKALAKRLEELKITLVYQGISDKLPVYQEILHKYGVDDYQVAYMGDDLPDIPLLKRVGLAAAPSDAVAEVKKLAHFCAPYCGGNGAVRALAEYILKAQGMWDY